MPQCRAREAGPTPAAQNSCEGLCEDMAAGPALPLPHPLFSAVRRSFAFKLTLLTLAWLLLAIACEQIPARAFWPALFGALTTPGALLLTALLALYWLRRNWRVALLPLLALGLTWPHVQRGLALHPSQRVADYEQAVRTNQGLHPTFLPDVGTAGTVSLLSANVRIFNVYAQLRDPDNASSKNFIRWLATSPADVLCLQEYYNEPGGTAEGGKVFRSDEAIGRASGRHAFVSTSLTNRVGAEFGMAIFSRYPIVRRGVIPFGKLTQNHAMWADLARPKDTIRIFNVHFQSMSMAESDIATATESRAGLRQKAPNLLRRFRNGAVARGTQVDTVLAHVRRSPYPVLLAGDFNDLPYSYTYDQLADHMQNAWATAGLGIGATYHGQLPFLRIDQQFASPQWQVLGCRVHQEIKWSDHYPLEALYQLK